MNAREVKRAFQELLPVVIVKPGMPPVECSYIINVIYSHSPKSKRTRVSCLCQDAQCPHSLIQANIRHMRLKSEYDRK